LNSRPTSEKIRIALLMPAFLLLNHLLSAQDSFRRTIDPKDSTKPMLTGIISRSLLEKDTAFRWMRTGYKAYKPSEKIVEEGRQQKEAHVLVFGGTWCEDTQFILPRFFRLADSCGISERQISLFAVDRSKQAPGGLSNAFHITLVPTFIVMHHGEEIGRVVEYGKTGNWDKELCELLKRAQ
jgi:hypothetical protein